MIIGAHDTDRKVVVIAEIGNNHEGDFSLARELIGLAAQAGADAVKFQTIVPEKLVAPDQSERIRQLKRFQFSPEQFCELKEIAHKHQLLFLSTPFDLDSAVFLNDLVPVFKIASGDNTFYPLIEYVAGTGKPLLISTGLLTLDGVRQLQKRIESVWQSKNIATGSLALLHCVVSYPTPAEQANLQAISQLKELGCVVGYSDHTLGIDAAVLSVALGARIIEKHFTISHTHSSFRDHQLSADPTQMRELVERVRLAETLLGSGQKEIQPCEQPNHDAVRRSIIALKELAMGEVIQAQHLGWTRPGKGLAPGQEQSLIGRRARRVLPQGHPLSLDDVE